MAASRQYNPKRQSPQRNAKKRRSGASPSRRGNTAVPGWLWLVAGLGIGILATSLWKLTDADPAAAPTGREQRAQQQQAARAQQQRPAKAAPAKAEAKPAAKPAEQAGTRFDFYTLLPEREVLVPSERELPAATPATAGAGAAANAAATTPAAATAAAAPVYLLQAGSFRAPAEADRRRAQILLLGLEARVETVNANGDTWYRVHAGPFQAGDRLAQARALLSGEGIETLLLKQKPAG